MVYPRIVVVQMRISFSMIAEKNVSVHCETLNEIIGMLSFSYNGKKKGKKKQIVLYPDGCLWSLRISGVIAGFYGGLVLLS